MEVLLLTVFLSLLLATVFLMLFLRDGRTRKGGSLEQEALRPFQNETPRETQARK